ncbi:hypothetical protein AVEN_132633-1 [Araneus ventricosus]|uniref:Reverse transcriptase domain-containing protein n=1 Tax=Araneus ventricosus TaxID=182803 RepID=A0A4Y2AUM4_ARAVE|nr:hypothetical protein AVEN_132633-1 [Araneus ventricosus]
MKLFLELFIVLGTTAILARCLPDSEELCRAFRENGMLSNRTSNPLLQLTLQHAFLETEKGLLPELRYNDVQNAFNSVSWGQIKQLLRQFRVPSKIGKLIDNFLQDRSVLLEDGKIWEYNIGVPRGSSCGPVLCLLEINEVLNMRNIENDAYIQAQVDDIVVMLRSTASYHFTNMSKPIMGNLEEWARNYKLSFIKEKTNYSMFKFLKKITHFPSIHLYGSRISHDKELSYLGIRVDSNLSFILHLNKVQTNICKINGKTRRITRATWGLRPEILKEIYSVVIESIVTYGSEIWYGGTVKQKNKLLQIQRIMQSTA